ncbi:lactose-binding lectin l-2-like [Ruditapes philippinarum]|uniref:lactose-binding lectin l-2-like n=1 Tax=Ruditapes philippinarum TaxID=129788 RepID=UPI00295B93B8|nr:lactose-binding lectin l-2-like [Ruditapes philippinarum]
MQCLTICADSSSCFGVFHDEAYMHCVGCNDKFLTNSSAPSLDGMKYYFKQRYMLVTEEKTWGNASLHCQTLGGYLADITSEEDEIHIVDQVLGSDYTNITWIGASRNESGGTFYWEDGTPISADHRMWGPNEPMDDRNEKCLTLSWEEGAWAWHDYHCNFVFWSLCEFD